MSGEDEQEQTELTESFLKFLFSLLPPVKKLRAVTGGFSARENDRNEKEVTYVKVIHSLRAQ